MREHTGEQTLPDRAALDARIAFVAAAFLLAYAFTALLDRVGAPERFVGAAPPYFTVLALATLGFLLHSMRVSVYYTASRAAPAAYAGFANAAIVVAMTLPFAARLAGRSWGLGVVCGIFLGLAAGAFYLGPLLRKSGLFSLSSLLAARFPDAAPRLGLIGAVALASCLLALAGVHIAVEALVDLSGASRPFAAFLIGAASLVVAGPGGLAGVIWASAAAGGVALLGLAWPLAALALHGDLPAGLIGGGGEAWRGAAELLGVWGVAPGPTSLLVEIGATIAVALGLACLAPTLAPAVTTADVAATRRAGYASFFWTIVFALLVAATVAAAALNLSANVAGEAPERLPPAVYTASARGLVSICGASARGPSEAQRACAKQGLATGQPLAAANVRPVDGDYLLGALPEIAGLGAAASGLLTSALVAFGLALAAAGLQACATAVGHDALYQMRGEIDLTSRRLAISRLALVVVSTLAYVTSVAHLTTPGPLVAMAIAISAACVAPAVALTFWRRAGNREAIVALAGGMAGVAFSLLAAESARRVEVYAIAGLVGATLGLAFGIVSGLASGGEKPEARAFVLRLLRGDGQVMQPDKGA